MSTWKDPFTTPPEPYATIWFRRYPELTPPLQGVWCPNEGTVTLGPGNSWSLPCDLVSKWRQPGYTIPVPATATPSGWRDPVLYPPAENQRCWVRRFAGSTAAVAAIWRPEDQAFALTLSGKCTICIKWHYVWQWKPR